MDGKKFTYTPDAKSLADLFQRHLKALSSGKRQYKKADELLGQLAKKAKVGELVELPNGSHAVLVDNFSDSDKLVHWGHGAVRRYEVELVDN